MKTDNHNPYTGTKASFKFKVNIFEYERGWGSKLDEEREFNTYDEAEKCIKDFNSQNTEAQAPDWYMVAERANYKL